jgi:hypothetical protein
MIEEQGTLAPRLGRELIEAACKFLDAGGKIKFPLRVIPGLYPLPGEYEAMVAEATPAGQPRNSERDVVDAAERAAREREEGFRSEGLPNPPGSRKPVAGKRARKSPGKSEPK